MTKIYNVKGRYVYVVLYGISSILERDIIGIDHLNNNQLCYFKSEADLEDGAVTLNRKTLYEHPKITMYNNLLDAHLYIVEKWVCDFIKAEE